MRLEVNNSLAPSVEKPWLKFFSEEARNAEFPQKTIYRYMRDCNVYNGRKAALNYFDNLITYDELFANIDAAAAAFTAAGVKAGDIVPCCSVTVPEMVFTMYALSKIGAAPLMIDPRTAVNDVASFIDESKSEVFVVIDVAYERLEEMLFSKNISRIVVISADTSMPRLVRFIKQLKMPAPKIEYNFITKAWVDFIALGADTEVQEVPYTERHTAAVTLTGGTTGFPKGVMLSDDGFNAVAMSFRYCGVTYKTEHKFLDIIPMCFSYGIVSSLHMPLSLGLQVVIIPKFDSYKIGHYIKKHKPEHTLLVPAHYEKLMNSKEMRNGFDLSFFATAGSGGDTMNVGLENKINDFLFEHGCKFPLSQGYGMSEVSSAACCSCNGNFKSLSVGYPLLETTISVFKPNTTEECDYCEVGEICISGPSIMLGYLNNQEESDKVMIKHPDGNIWVHSGDVGYIDEDGFIFVKGRIKRMITKFDGHKVYPTHIESTISKHPKVQSCAVVGVKDKDHAQGMLPLAVVELVKETGIDNETVISEITELCDTELEERGRPFEIIIMETMPRTNMGKIDYFKLTDDYDNNILLETNAS